MMEERKKVLEMLAKGTISVADAEKLLEKIGESSSGEAKAEGHSPSEPSKPRFMRIVVDEPGKNQVNIRMPLSFMRAGTRLLAMLPQKIGEKLAEHGVDFAAHGAMNEKAWADTVENMNIDIEQSNGEKVKIFCE
jgi:hypothetical protein